MTANETATAPRSMVSPLRLLLQGFRGQALNSLGDGGRALDALALSDEADHVHDAHLEKLVHVAAIGATEAAVRGCGCAHRFDRVLRLGTGAQQWDEREDRLKTRGAGLVTASMVPMRRISSTTERLLTRRATP